MYGVVGFGVTQVADVMLPNLGLPDWTVTLVVALVILGFPLALVLSWMFDVTPEGVERTAASPVPAATGPAPAADAAVETAAAPERPAAPRTSIAILPFANMSDSADNEYFSDGITEDILAHVSSIGALQVVSHTSVKRYKGTDKPIEEIARELSVGCVVEGSVRRAGDRVRVVAQLIDATSDRHLWAETYDRDLTDIFAVQTDVAKKIAAALEAQMTEEDLERIEERPTDSVEAYELVLRARAELLGMTATSLEAAMELRERALDIQPDYREALTLLLGALYNVLAIASPRREEQVRRIDGLRRRLERLDPESSEAHYLAGTLETYFGWDWAKARRELDAALAPQDFSSRVGRVMVGLYTGEPAEIVDLALEPPAFRAGDPFCEETAGVLLVLGGRFREGLALLEPWVTREPGGDLEDAAARRRGHRGGLGARDAKRARVRVAYTLAQTLALTGDFDGVLHHLERGLRERAVSLPAIGLKGPGPSLWTPLYPHSRFQAVFSAVFPGRELPTA